MVDPIAPVSASGIQSAIAAFDESAHAVTVASLPPSDAQLVSGEPTRDIQGMELKEYPPAFVFAPGFLHADRRGMVAYPGMEIHDAMMKMVLTKRYVEANVAVFHQMKDLYEEIVKLGKHDDDPAQ
jgi:flagellar basal body rod protein FlgC